LRGSSSSDTSSATNTRRRSRSSFSNQSRDVRESSFDENEEYAYAENQRSMSYKVRINHLWDASPLDSITWGFCTMTLLIPWIHYSKFKLLVFGVKCNAILLFQKTSTTISNGYSSSSSNNAYSSFTKRYCLQL
jgi:hypothetical protein